jgi:hypothetical protein
MVDPKNISPEDAQRMFDYVKNNAMDVPLPQWLQDIAGETTPEPGLDNAFCNAVLAIQDNYTYDSFEQAQMIINLAMCSTIDELNSTLENCDVHGYDLNMSLRDHVNSIRNRNKQPA